MKRKLVIAVVALSVFCACNGDRSTATRSVRTDTTTQPAANGKNIVVADAAEKGQLPRWANQLIEDYISKTNSPLIAAAKSEHISESWLFDQLLPTDTAKFIVVQIGHDVSEPNGGDTRYVADQWLYIDTISRKVYEYDLPNDSLMIWKGK